MTTDARTDHDDATCPYSWCTAHQPACDCAYGDRFPHPRDGDRNARIDAP